jgi:hypothetical protein
MSKKADKEMLFDHEQVKELKKESQNKTPDIRKYLIFLVLVGVSACVLLSLIRMKVPQSQKYPPLPAATSHPWIEPTPSAIPPTLDFSNFQSPDTGFFRMLSGIVYFWPEFLQIAEHHQIPVIDVALLALEGDSCGFPLSDDGIFDADSQYDEIDGKSVLRQPSNPNWLMLEAESAVQAYKLYVEGYVGGTTNGIKYDIDEARRRALQDLDVYNYIITAAWNYQPTYDEDGNLYSNGLTDIQGDVYEFYEEECIRAQLHINNIAARNAPMPDLLFSAQDAAEDRTPNGFPMQFP